MDRQHDSAQTVLGRNQCVHHTRLPFTGAHYRSAVAQLANVALKTDKGIVVAIALVSDPRTADGSQPRPSCRRSVHAPIVHSTVGSVAFDGVTYYEAAQIEAAPRRPEKVLTMRTAEFLRRASAGHVRIVLTDGQSFTGRFRTDILSSSALSAFFYGDVRDLSLTIEDVVTIEEIELDPLISQDGPSAPPNASRACR